MLFVDGSREKVIGGTVRLMLGLKDAVDVEELASDLGIDILTVPHPMKVPVLTHGREITIHDGLFPQERKWGVACGIGRFISENWTNVWPSSPQDLVPIAFQAETLLPCISCLNHSKETLRYERFAAGLLIGEGDAETEGIVSPTETAKTMLEEGHDLSEYPDLFDTHAHSRYCVDISEMFGVPLGKATENDSFHDSLGSVWYEFCST